MRYLLSVVLLGLLSNSVWAQGVKISSSPGTPDSSAILELDASNRGFLLPRLSTAQRNGINNPAVGLQIYNTTSQCVETYFPLGWRATGCNCVQFPNTGFSFQPAFPSAGAAVQFSAADTNQSYQWSFASGTPASDTVWNPSSTFANAGNYQVTLVVTDSLGCSDSSTQTLNVQNCPLNVPDPGFTMSPNPAGNGQTVNFSPNTLSGVSYSWTFGSGTPGSSILAAPSAVWSQAGTYSVGLTVTDSATGCTQTSSQNITINNCVTGGSANFLYTGNIVLWSVPAGVCQIQVEAWGARGGAGGGRGAYVAGTFTVSPGTTFKILVGQEGGNGNGGGGGGGTFFVDNNNTPFLIAGGGGGLGYSNNYNASVMEGGRCQNDGCNATAGSCGTPGNGGTAGQGGQGGTCTQNGTGGGGGGGLLTGGGAANGCNYSSTTGGQAFVNGGAGGNGGCGVAGGFGGGGGGGCNGGGGGGGGGYSGGGGANPWCSWGGTGGNGAGGGCFNSGTNQTLTPGGNQQNDGRLFITW